MGGSNMGYRATFVLYGSLGHCLDPGPLGLKN